MEKQSKLKCDVPAVCFELYGNRFFVALDEKTEGCCKKLCDEARTRLDALKSGAADNKKTNKEACRFLCEGLDRLLGKGAVRRVLGKDRWCIREVSELMCFVLNALGGAQ